MLWLVLVRDRHVYNLSALCLHFFLMFAVSVTVMNVQVSTRFLSTCSPLYILCAAQAWKGPGDHKIRWVRRFFVAYAALGCFLFPNFLPWV